jgi:hypothetical protein
MVLALRTSVANAHPRIAIRGAMQRRNGAARRPPGAAVTGSPGAIVDQLGSPGRL